MSRAPAPARAPAVPLRRKARLKIGGRQRQSAGFSFINNTATLAPPRHRYQRYAMPHLGFAARTTRSYLVARRRGQEIGVMVVPSG
ncbi:hypothetical protein KCP69_05260 [Salmonella enterica subsp. enterica]|nr:hypothetical protein KCP69_05260 [Salmonella enterica subsp. enterica]